tara:strand:- start:24527 stop:24973 length:447 start_codon:yes stop_codon:yes gene_type:complete
MAHSLPNISVGDFALDILKEMAKDPKKSLAPSLKESTMEAIGAPDIKNVEVSVDFVNSIIEGKNSIVKPRVQETKKVVPIKESKEVRLQSLVERLSGLVKEAKLLMEEMTSTGNIGVNMAGPGNKAGKSPKKSKLSYGAMLKRKYGLD